MSRDEGTTDERTRRQYLTLGAAAAGSAVLAGCVGGGSESDQDGDGTGEGTADETSGGNTTDQSATDETDDAATDESGGDETTDSYTVEMAPVGTVEFDAVPEQWSAYDGSYADMAVALGQAEGFDGIGGADRYYTYPYDELPGVEVPRDRVEEHPEVRTKEEFYELDNDVHLYDPNMLINWFDWNQSDVDEIAENVGPFAGNLIFRRSDQWHDYRYYTLYEAFEKVAEVFQERERYEAFAELHDEFLADIQSRLPPAGERPTVLLTYENSLPLESFSPYRLNDGGTSKKQFLDLGVRDALAGTDVEQLSTTERGKLDYENLLEVDPDVIMLRAHERKSRQEFLDEVVVHMEEHPVGKELSAVQNGRVYRGGFLHQGPIHNLFLTERSAKQLYPDEFGDVTSDTELFDRERVANIVTGDFE